MLGIAYNVFDGEELLEGSVKTVRPVANYIVAVCQTVSNYGQHYTGGYEECLRLADEGLIDEVIVMDVAGQSAGHKERQKRDRGLAACVRSGCDIVAFMDCDEYYVTEQYQAAYNRFENSDFDGSCCKMRTYYKRPTLQLYPPEKYVVPLFHRVQRGDKTIDKYPVLADPTRRLRTTKFLPFMRDEIEMHHYSFVRNNIRRKLENSSAKRNFERDIDIHVQQWFNAQEGDVINYFGEGKRLVACENTFGIGI